MDQLLSSRVGYILECVLELELLSFQSVDSSAITGSVPLALLSTCFYLPTFFWAGWIYIVLNRTSVCSWHLTSARTF
jgi:hypothetical protein